MKITCNTKELQAKIAIAYKAVSTRLVDSCFSLLTLTADEASQRVTLAGYSTQVVITSSFKCGVIESGTIALPSKTFKDAVSHITEPEITLECETTEALMPQASYIATLTTNSRNLSVTCYRPEKSLKTFKVTEGSTFELPAELLQQSLKSCAFSASNPGSTSVLAGVNIVSSVDETSKQVYLNFAATDSYRLAVTRVPVGSTNELINVTVPIKAVGYLLTLLNKKALTVQLRYDTINIELEVDGNTIATSRICDYPNYRQLIPINFSRRVLCNRKKLIESLTLTNSVIKNNTVLLSLEESKQELTISGDTIDTNHAKQTMLVEFKGDNLSIALNIKYLLEVLKVITSEEVRMQFNNKHDAIVITPFEGLETAYLLMPVK